MIKFSSSLKLNKIHIVDIFFNEDPKNISSFSREALILGGHFPKKFIWPNVFGYRLEITKISLKNFHSFSSYLEKS